MQITKTPELSVVVPETNLSMSHTPPFVSLIASSEAAYLKVSDVSENLRNAKVSLSKVFNCADNSGNPAYVETLTRFGNFKGMRWADAEDLCELAAEALYQEDWDVILTKDYVEYLKHRGYDAIEVSNELLQAPAEFAYYLLSIDSISINIKE